jgi:polyvinyl alcohol dehydrogenase (cytochrome)
MKFGMFSTKRLAALGAIALALLPFTTARADPPTVAAVKASGARLFAERCAQCHGNVGGNAPSRDQLGQLSVVDIYKTLAIGPMAPRAQGLSMQEISALAAFVNEKPGRPDPVATANMCHSAPPPDPRAAQWNGWGSDLINSRYAPDAGISAANVGQLKLQWAFSYPGDMIYGQPTIIDGRVFVTSITGRVQALDARTGCTIWTYESGSPIRTAITVAATGPQRRALAFFGDEDATSHALDANTGALVWQTRVDSHRAARITGAPVFYRDHLYVPVSSSEEIGALPPYHCCTFRGSLVALDAATGRQIWKTYTIAQAPDPYSKSPDGTQLLGPAGAAIWSAPTLDTTLNRIYVGTGDSYTGVPVKTSDAILALDMKTGHMLWSHQVLADDNYLVGCYIKKPSVCTYGVCYGPGEGECPQKVGPDYDFGASPILRSLPSGRRLLLSGSKSGVVYAMDPDKDGKLIWQTKVGIGGAAGGIEWGIAATPSTVYAPSSDLFVTEPALAGGITALDITTGKILWHAHPKPVCYWGPQNCWGSQSQAPTAAPGAVLEGGMDGHLRAFEAKSGAVIWDFDAGGGFATVNQGQQIGGAFSLGGPALAGGMLFVNSGYGRFAGQNGHVLLAFGLGEITREPGAAQAPPSKDEQHE